MLTYHYNIIFHTVNIFLVKYFTLNSKKVTKRPKTGGL